MEEEEIPKGVKPMLSVRIRLIHPDAAVEQCLKDAIIGFRSVDKEGMDYHELGSVKLMAPTIMDDIYDGVGMVSLIEGEVLEPEFGFMDAALVIMDIGRQTCDRIEIEVNDDIRRTYRRFEYTQDSGDISMWLVPKDKYKVPDDDFDYEVFERWLDDLGETAKSGEATKCPISMILEAMRSLNLLLEPHGGGAE